MATVHFIDGKCTEARAPDGTRLAVYEWGQLSGPEVLLIHGFEIGRAHV